MYESWSENNGYYLTRITSVELSLAEPLKSGFKYRSGTVNSNTVNSKFHLIRSFFEIFAKFLSFHV